MHGIHELPLKIGRETPHLAEGLPDLPQHTRKLLGPDDDERHDPDNEQFADVEIEH
jgi:hypothetical protein